MDSIAVVSLKVPACLFCIILTGSATWSCLVATCPATRATAGFARSSARTAASGS